MTSLTVITLGKVHSSVFEPVTSQFHFCQKRDEKHTTYLGIKSQILEMPLCTGFWPHAHHHICVFRFRSTFLMSCLATGCGWYRGWEVP